MKFTIDTAAQAMVVKLYETVKIIVKPNRSAFTMIQLQHREMIRFSFTRLIDTQEAFVKQKE